MTAVTPMQDDLVKEENNLVNKKIK